MRPLSWQAQHEFALPGHELDLWWCPQAEASLPRQRRQRLDRLLRQLLSRYLPSAPEALRFGREARGRPFLVEAAAPDFNLSDTRGGTLVAITARGRVGVDLERQDRQLPVTALAARWFADRDRERLAALPPELARQQFLCWWTAKEAACKATGTGIFGWLPQWRFSCETVGERLQAEAMPADADAGAHWSFRRLHPAPDYLAVVCGTGLPPPQAWRGFVLASD